MAACCESITKAFFRTRTKFDCTPLIYQGVLYVGGEDGFVYAIKITGFQSKNLWDHMSGRGQTEWFINSAPALSPGKSLVVAARDEHLYGFDFDGAEQWRLHIRGQMLGSPVVSPQGDTYVGVSLEKGGSSRGAGKLICVGAASHRMRWEYSAGGNVESTPVVGDDGVVYFGDNSGLIHAVSPEGKSLWKTDVGAPVRSAGNIVAPGRLVFGLDDGALVGLACSSQGIASGGWPKYMAPH